MEKFSRKILHRGHSHNIHILARDSNHAGLAAANHNLDMLHFDVY